MNEALKTGATLKNLYEIVRLIEESEIANLYTVKDVAQFRRWVLREIFLPEDDENLKDILVNHITAEFERIMQLDHPTLPKYQELFFEGNRAYIVREYIEGRTFKDLIEKQTGALSEPQILAWSRQLCNALTYLHELEPPFYFGPISPGKIMLTTLGKVRFMDYGIARFFPFEIESEILKTTKEEFIAPEQKEGIPASEQSDIYAMGTFMYYLLTGRDTILNKTGFPPMHTLRSNTSLEMEEAISRSLEFSPQLRYRNMQDFKEAFGGEEEDTSHPLLGSNTLEINFEDVKKGKILSGEILIYNQGGGTLSANIRPSVAWIRVSPDNFYENEETVRFWIDTSALTRGLVYEGSIDVFSKEDLLQIPVTVTMRAEPIKLLPPPLAGLMLLVPLAIMVFILYRLLDFANLSAWNEIVKLLEASKKGTGMSHLDIANLANAPLPPMTYLNMKIFALFALIFPFLGPLMTAQFYENLSDLQQRILKTFYAVTLFAPSVILGVALNFRFVNPALQSNPAMRYLDLSRIVTPFLIINVLCAIYFAAGKNKQLPAFLTKRPATLIGIRAILIFLYLWIIYLYVIK